MLKVAIQGDEGSNHHLISQKIWPEGDFSILPCKTFPEVFANLIGNKCDLAVIAIENTIAGSILPNYDLLTNNEVEIIAEAQIRIKHYLIGLPGADLTDVKAAYSHEMALKQCHEFLEENDIEPREYFDTAAAVPFVVSKKKKSWAAIAPEIAAEIYGGEVIAKEIETNKQNYTRFVVLAKSADLLKSQIVPEKIIPAAESADLEHNKVSLEFVTSHKKGSLVAFLNVLAENGYNFTKIESRPIIGSPWEYRFYLDFVTHESPKEIKKSLTKAAKDLRECRILGIYKPGMTY